MNKLTKHFEKVKEMREEDENRWWYDKICARADARQNNKGKKWYGNFPYRSKCPDNFADLDECAENGSYGYDYDSYY
ncbi:MAG: hypothetical protein WCQ80_02605 [Bacilli bacterium]